MCDFSSASNSWEEESFDYEVDVDDGIDHVVWMEEVFNYEVGIEHPFGNYSWIVSSFDYEVDVHGFYYTNWSDYWRQGTFSRPAVTNPSPANNSLNNILNFNWSCLINNSDGNNFNWSIECSNGQTNSSNNDGNGTKELTLSGLAYSETYTVWVNATGNKSSILKTSEVFYFSTLNAPPDITNPSPTNNTYVSISTSSISVYISDDEGDLMDWSIEFSDGTFSSGVNSGNSTKSHSVSLDYDESYKWWVNVTDGIAWTREWFVFDTYDNQRPTITNPSPINNSLGQNITDTTSFTVYISDPDSDLFSWTIECSSGDSSSGNLQSAGTKTCTLTTPLDYNTEYLVWVNATDPGGSNTWNYSWFVFNTEAVGGSPPTVVINTTTGIEETNATGNAYASNSIFPMIGYFRYGTSLSSLSSTEAQSLATGEFSKNISGLSPGTYYYLQARASNAYGTNSTSFINFLTKPQPPTGLTASNYNHTYVYLTWTKGSGADNTRLERNTVESWARGTGTLLYNNTLTYYNHTTVNPGTTYYYQAWSYAKEGSNQQYSDQNTSFNISTPPQPPQNTGFSFSLNANGTGNLSITWNKGTGADYTLIRKGTTEAPSDPEEGVEVDNDTGTSKIDTYISEAWLYTLWSWNDTVGLYSEPVYLGWYASWIRVFNESKPSQAVTNWSVEVSNPDGSEVYASNDNNNPLIINISDMPSGENIGFSFSADGYKNRVYQKDVSDTGVISFDAYLPPDRVPTTDPVDGGDVEPNPSDLRYHTESSNITDPSLDQTINLDYEIYEIDTVEKYERVSYDRFIHADSKTVSNPAVDLVMTLNFTCDEIYQIVAYENLNAEDIYTDSAAVTNPAVDKNITFSHLPVGQVLGVYLYNDTIYGGWVWVSADHYTYDSTNVTVNNTIMDENTSMVKVDYILDVLGQGVTDRPIAHTYATIAGYTATINSSALNTNTTLVRIEYYTYVNEYYTWIDIPKQKYTSTTTSVTVNSSELSEDTLLLRVKYYSYEGTSYIEPQLYVLRVVDLSGSAVDNAKVIVKRYINTTGIYEEVGSYITDGNGQIEIFLIPFVNYKVQINASGQGFETKTYDYTPSDSVFVHTFKIDIDYSSSEEENMFAGITWDIEPHNHYQRSNFTFYFNITADYSDLEWFSATISYYNETLGQWVVLYTENVTTQPSGGSISYTISHTNITLIAGKYKIECWYKKEGYPAYEVTQTGSTLVFLDYGGFGDSPVWDYIPDWVYLLVTVIIMALVMAVLLPVAGLGTGYIGIGIMALALMLKPDLMMDSGISGWAILTITALVYTFALFIWSRI